MSAATANATKVNQSAINTSPTKQMYTFPKSRRFNSLSKSSYGDSGYDKPNAFGTRGAGIGYGSRWGLISDKTKVPNAYDHKSEFTQKDKGQCFSFSLGRDKCTKIWNDGRRTSDAYVPPPTAYNVRTKPGEEASKFSMRPRTQQTVITKNGASPGPADYNIGSEINKTGAFINSKFAGTGVKHFDPPRSKRFPGLKEWVPGPSEYQPKLDMSNKGDYFLSTFQSDGCRTFYHANRPDMSHTSIKFKTPGPGAYQSATEFGI